MENNQRVQARDGSGKLVLPDGAMVRDYQLRYLTSGGMSVVYVGIKGEREFILKEVPASSVKEVPALIQEKGLLERLNHPGIVKFEALFDHQDFFYLVLEFIQGRPLIWYQREGNRASVEQVLDWGVQLCEIFGYLHQQDPPVIYRDLKPENVILSDGQLRLIDFGIARVHKGDRSSDTELMGTVTTASPEHYGSGETDARSDIYTLGATLYDLLSGGRRASQMAFKFAPIRDLNPDAPPALEEALATALAFKPEDRFQSMEEFGQALLHCQGKAPKPARRAPSEGGKGPSRGLIAALLVLLLLVGGGYQYALGSAAPPVDPVEKITENNLDGDVFFSGKVDQHDVVTLGEDISLFAVSDTNAKAGEERARTVAERLNKLYQAPCLVCSLTWLEPEDIRVGRFKENGEVVVFHAHMHDGVAAARPFLIATVTDAQAKEFGQRPRFLAAYWRDLLRDVIDLSRGTDARNSALSGELEDELLEARHQMGDAANVKNLHQVLKRLTASKALKLSDVFLQVPDRAFSSDDFPEVEGFEPLKS